MLGDFALRLGSAVISSGTRRGVFLEIEYRPLASLPDAAAVLGEMAHLVLPQSLAWQDEQITQTPADALAQYSLGAAFSARHVLAQYLALLRADAIL